MLCYWVVIASLWRGTPGSHSRPPTYSMPARNRQPPIHPQPCGGGNRGLRDENNCPAHPRAAEGRIEQWSNEGESQTSLNRVTSPTIWSPDAGSERLTPRTGENPPDIIQWPSTQAPGPPQRGSCRCYFGGNHIFLMTCKNSL